MKQWMNKLIDQFGFEWSSEEQADEFKANMSEDRATLLFIIDIFNKHLLEIDKMPVRKTRQILDEFAQELLNPQRKDFEKVFYKLRQFFKSYRLDEYTYIHKTFDEFRAIIWDFVEQISEEIEHNASEDPSVQEHLEHLKEAVESDSIEDLKSQSRQFIDAYVEYQSRKDESRQQRVNSLSQNLKKVKKRLQEVNQSMRRDHLTNAFNRKSFDEQLQQQVTLLKAAKTPSSLIVMDIDHFKKFNDTYGHAIGDFVLVELVKLLQEQFVRECDVVARIGGEEFAIILPEYKMEHALKKVIETLQRIREEVYVHQAFELRFTVSMGVAELSHGESAESWLKRADDALYASKNGGRNKYTIANEYKPKLTAA